MSEHEGDPFLDANGRPRVVRGLTMYAASPRLAELAGRVGFETVWIEMEHGPSGFDEVERQCAYAEAGGAMPTVRIAGGTRENVLRALEVGARLVVAPMTNTTDQARLLVEWGRYPPQGRRGYNTRSRGARYGLRGPLAEFAAANARTCLFPQIETPEAIENVPAICAVAGLSGIFIGPGDLSACLGIPSQMADAGLIRMVTGAIAHARGAGLHAGILVAPGPMADAALAAGADLVFFGGDIMNLVEPWTRLLANLPTSPAEVGRGAKESQE
jgi:4-hydroxy-2-oxoheptanedioate aldolase